jgi:glutamate 5-kinase
MARTLIQCGGGSRGRDYDQDYDYESSAHNFGNRNRVLNRNPSIGSHRSALDSHQKLRYLFARSMRSELDNAKRIVVKLGTAVLTDERKQPDPAQMGQLVAQMAGLQKAGKEIVIVTSGAVGAGMGVLKYDKRPESVAEQQACAAVGQSRLMAAYEKLFAEYSLHVAQVLVTHADLQHEERHRNARNTLLTLLRRGVIPIINENDAVSTTELKFGDNDKLSALVTALLPAELLVILTSVDGVMENFGKANARRIPVVESIDERIEALAGGTSSATAVGGMKSKIQAAKIVMRSGIPLVIAPGRSQTVLGDIVRGADIGTLFLPKPAKLRGRKRWIAFFHHPRGSVFVDAGARRALMENGKSLLPPGVTRCEGEFEAGEIVSICDQQGAEFARGIAAYSSGEICARKVARGEIVHRDDLVIL